MVICASEETLLPEATGRRVYPVAKTNKKNYWSNKLIKLVVTIKLEVLKTMDNHENINNEKKR